MNILLSFLLIVLINNAFAQVQKFASLKNTIINLRNGPSKEYKVISSYHSRQPVEIMHKFNQWYMIRDYYGNIGWIHMNLMALSRKKRTIIAIDNLDICRFPDKTNCQKIGKLSRNAVATLQKCNSQYCRILDKKQHFAGWILQDKIYGVYQKEIF